MLHSGIDLHKNDLVISTVDAGGTEVLKKRLRTGRSLVSRYFAALPGPHRGSSSSRPQWLSESVSQYRNRLRLGWIRPGLVLVIALASLNSYLRRNEAAIAGPHDD